MFNVFRIVPTLDCSLGKCTSWSRSPVMSHRSLESCARLSGAFFSFDAILLGWEAWKHGRVMSMDVNHSPYESVVSNRKSDILLLCVTDYCLHCRDS